MTKSKPLTPDEVKKRHGQAEFDKAHNRFLAGQAEIYGPKDWQHDLRTKKHFIDNDNLYQGDQRKFVLVEIHENAGPGFQPFPNLGWTLYVKGKSVSSDSNLERLKGTAEKLLVPKKRKKRKKKKKK